MTDEELAAIKARTDAATPGPWWHHGYYIYCGPRDATAEDRVGNPNKIAHARRMNHERADTAFIAAARTDISALLAEVEASREIVRAVAAARPHGRSVVYFHPPLLPDGQTLEGYSDNIIQLDALWCEQARALLGDAAGDGEVSR